MRTERAGECVTGGHPTKAATVARLVPAVVLAALIVSAPVRAQESEANPNEVPIGTFTLGPSHKGFSIVEPPDGVPKAQRDGADDGSGSWFFQNWDSASPKNTSAEDLFRDAMKALEAGRREDAQRLFERLIAEEPDSPRVAAARQHLGQLYLSTEAAASVPPAPAASGPGDEALPWTSGKAGASAPLEVSEAPSRAALHQARVSSVLDSQFLSDAGDRVFFSAGSADLGIRARGVIQSQARFLIRFPELSAAIEGYADDGSLPDAESQRLSEERAAVVRDRLINEGVDAGRLVAYGRGRADRVSDCPAPECLAQNRRAVTVLLNRPIEAHPARRAQGNVGGPSPSPTQ